MGVSRTKPSRRRAPWLASAAVALALLAAGRAAADFDAGFTAYLSGDYKTAFQSWLPLAQEGDADAEFGIGMLYERGEGVPPDLAEAARWYLKAAQQDHALAQTSLASMYERGRGVAQSFREAAKWYRRAAELGNAQAQFNLGSAYEYGLGVPTDFGQAMAWYEAAARQGYSRAMAKLAELREQGDLPATPPEEDFGFVEEPVADAQAAIAEASIPPEEPAPEERTETAQSAAPPPPPAPAEPAGALAAAEADAIRLSSYFDRDSALLGWEELKKENSDLLGALSSTVIEIGPDAAGAVFYRLMAGPLQDAAAAALLCEELGRRGVACSPAKL